MLRRPTQVALLLPWAGEEDVGDAAGAASPAVGLGYRCLLAITTRRFRPDRDLAPPYRRPFEPYLRGGWDLRAAPPRYFVCWRNSGLLTRGEVPIAVLPDGQFGLGPEQRAALCLYELLRRAARVALLARGLDPRPADGPRGAAALREAAADRLFGGTFCPARTRRFFAGIEVRVNAAVLGEVRLPPRRDPDRHGCCHGC
jgi:hypothetical protein